MLKIYVASSWRNPHYEALVKSLEDRGHKVNDWKDPEAGPILPDWKDVGVSDKDRVYSWIECLRKPEVYSVFTKDLQFMESSDVCILLTPCGRSAHIEAGYMIGRGKPVIVFAIAGEGWEPELMYLLAPKIVSTKTELYYYLESLQGTIVGAMGRGIKSLFTGAAIWGASKMKK